MPDPDPASPTYINDRIYRLVKSMRKDLFWSAQNIRPQP